MTGTSEIFESTIGIKYTFGDANTRQGAALDISDTSTGLSHHFDGINAITIYAVIAAAMRYAIDEIQYAQQREQATAFLDELDKFAPVPSAETIAKADA